MLSDAPRFVATDMNTVSSNATTVVLYLVVGLCRQFVRWPCFKGGGRGKRVKAGRAIEPLPALLFVCTGRCHKSRGNARRRMLRTSPPGGLTPWRAGAALERLLVAREPLSMRIACSRAWRRILENPKKRDLP